MRRFGAVIVAVALTSCATAIHHDLQSIPVTSTPPGASVQLDCGRGAMSVGTTPMTLTLQRRDRACMITLTKTGWQQSIVQFHRTLAPAALTNVVPAGLAAGIVESSHVEIAGNNGSTSGGIVTASASGSGSISPVAVAGIVLSAGLLIDIHTGAVFEQSPRRVDIRLEPKR